MLSKHACEMVWLFWCYSFAIYLRKSFKLPYVVYFIQNGSMKLSTNRRRKSAVFFHPIRCRTKSIGTFRSNLCFRLLYSNDNLTARNRSKACYRHFLFFFLTERWNKSVRLRPGQERGSRGRGVLRGLHLPNGKTLHAGSWKGAYTKTIRETDCNIPREWLGLTDCWGNQEAMKTTCIHVNLGQWSTSFPSRSPSRQNALGTRLDSGMDFAETATGCNYLSLLP